jgi:hypothetical protein
MMKKQRELEYLAQRFVLGGPDSQKVAQKHFTMRLAERRPKLLISALIESCR